MEIEIRSSGVDLLEALRGYMQRRMHFRFDRHPELIRRLTVRLSERSGANAGAKTICEITAELAPSGEILIRESAPDLYRAIGGAVERLGSALHRRQGQQRTARRGYASMRKSGTPRRVRRIGGRRNSGAKRPLVQRAPSEVAGA
jgi:ribosomal subunit interface protein